MPSKTPLPGSVSGPALGTGSCLVVGDPESPFGVALGAVIETAFAAAAAETRPDRAAFGRGAFEWSNPATLAPSPAGEADFLRRLATAPLAVIDASQGDASALYLLGVREALTQGVTLAGHVSEAPRWALQAWRPAWLDVRAEGASGQLVEAVRAVLYPGLQGWPNAIRRGGVAVSLADPEARFGPDETRLWRYPAARAAESDPPLIGLKCGDIRNVSDIDVWVNSENSLMQMARPWEKSISAYLRRNGARWTGLAKSRFDDALWMSLARATAERGEIAIGDVIVTPAPDRTELSQINNVKAVAHVAAVQPRADGRGFESGGDVRLCVHNVLRDVAAFARRRKANDCRKILFPLLGTGDAGAAPEIVASEMVSAIVEWRAAHAGGFPFDEIYLLAFNQRAKLACLAAISAAGCIPHAERSQT